MSNRRTSAEFRVRCSLVLTLLASRSQALPTWTPQELQVQLRRLGYVCSVRSIKRYIGLIRGAPRE